MSVVSLIPAQAAATRQSPRSGSIWSKPPPPKGITSRRQALHRPLPRPWVPPHLEQENTRARSRAVDYVLRLVTRNTAERGKRAAPIIDST